MTNIESVIVRMKNGEQFVLDAESFPGICEEVVLKVVRDEQERRRIARLMPAKAKPRTKKRATNAGRTTR